MATISATELVKRGLSALGVHGEQQTLEAYQGEQARLTLNNMFEQWNIEGLTVYNNAVNSFPLIAGQSSYTIGSGGDINTSRPSKIDQMYVRQTNIDYPIKEINQSDYNDIYDKTLSETLPQYYFYETQFPLGIIRFWGVPDSVLTVYYTSPSVFVSISALSDAVSYPDGYGKAIECNLAVELSRFYPGRLTSEVMQMAKESKDILLRMNAVKRMRNLVTDHQSMNDGSYDYNSLMEI